MAVTPYVKKEYTESEAVQNAQNAIAMHQQNKPADYSSQHQEQANALWGQINSRPKFQYNFDADALYQQAAQRYIQQGRQAMMDTMGQAAALTGGYGNSYAQSVGQQTYQGYLQGINDMLPQFYQMALDQYNAEGDDLYRRYAIESEQEAKDYDRYRDAVSDYERELDRLQSSYEAERGFDYGKYQDETNFDYSAWNNDRNYQYQLDRDVVEDEQWAQQLAYQRERAAATDAQWEREFAERVRQYNENLALQREIQMAQIAAIQRETSTPQSYSYSPSNVLSLGYGPISEDTLDKLVNDGKVGYTTSGGNVKFYNTPTANVPSVTKTPYSERNPLDILKTKVGAR